MPKAFECLRYFIGQSITSANHMLNISPFLKTASKFIYTCYVPHNTRPAHIRRLAYVLFLRSLLLPITPRNNCSKSSSNIVVTHHALPQPISVYGNSVRLIVFRSYNNEERQLFFKIQLLSFSETPPSTSTIKYALFMSRFHRAKAFHA